MAETIISAIADKVLGKLGSLAYQEVCLAWGVKNDIQKLAETLTTIKAVLLDAEAQQAHNHKLRVWLETLKEVCYDAEDVLDEIEVEALRQQVVNHGSFTKKVRRFCSGSNPLAFRFTMGHKIKEIRVRLAEIAADKANFNLTEKVENKHVIVRERETHSFVHVSDIIGRDKDKEEIIKRVISQSHRENVSVIPIVGIGGLGKTAVAKLVYNDEIMCKHFELKMWVCVSEDFDLKQLIIKIVKSATNQHYSNLDATNQNYSNLDLNHLQQILQQNLCGKKYLLVLDDVWNEVRERWIELKNLLIGGGYGSKIIVTTRSHQVASILGTMPRYTLGDLSIEECLSLFIRCAFVEGQEKQHPNLIKIGEEIVKKCGGVPLVVRTLGSLLYSSIDERKWKEVRDNEIWKLEQMENDVLPALRLSYDHLPPYLKQCFIYCSIFPKDYLFYNYNLVEFWIAHGLLMPYNENHDLENIGNRYLKELISRSFFQDIQPHYNMFGFKMHDLMHDLASSLMKSECLIVESSSQICPKTVRHLSFDIADQPELDPPSFLSDLSHVRTISFPYIGVGPNQLFLKSLISRFPFLRFLNLDASNIEVLPKRIGNLKHLRFLSLRGNAKIKALPNSICKLHNLQTLLLGGCDELVELPRDIRYLISLRLLYLTTKNNYFPENGIGCLTSLQYLSIFGCHNLEYLFDDIGCLKSLQTLRIVSCASLISLPDGIKHLSSLEDLVLINCERLNLNLSTGSEEDLNSTRPHLRLLVLRELPELVELPQWLLQLSADTLQTLYIEDCPNLSSLPEDMHCLTTLRQLVIDCCPALSQRCEVGRGEDWPKITNIPKIGLDGRWIKSRK